MLDLVVVNNRVLNKEMRDRDIFLTLVNFVM